MPRLLGQWTQAEIDWLAARCREFAAVNGKRRFFTPEQIEEISEHVNKPRKRVVQKIAFLRARGVIPDVPSPELDPLFGSHDDKPRDDGRFAAKMTQAIAAGHESPPMIGVDTRPCTRRPMAIEVVSGWLYFPPASSIWDD